MARREMAWLLAAVLLAVQCGDEYKVPLNARPPWPMSYVDIEPDWSPDGSTIVFRHGRDWLCLLDLASGARTHLTKGSWPAWSPDGRGIAYADMESKGICVMDVHSRRITRLTDWGWCIYPTWSPDGARIAFYVMVPPDSAGIWVMDSDGGNKTDLSVRGLSQLSSHDWSPDGLLIAHVRHVGGGACLKPFLFVMTPTGGNPVQITRTCRDHRHPRWSPDGQKIAYSSFSGDTSEETSGLWVMNADGSRQRQLASSPFAVRAAWSPDGTKIIYEGLNEDSWTITLWIMNADGSDQRPLTLP